MQIILIYYHIWKLMYASCSFSDRKKLIHVGYYKVTLYLSTIACNFICKWCKRTQVMMATQISYAGYAILCRLFNSISRLWWNQYMRWCNFKQVIKKSTKDTCSTNVAKQRISKSVKGSNKTRENTREVLSHVLLCSTVWLVSRNARCCLVFTSPLPFPALLPFRQSRWK